MEKSNDLSKLKELILLISKSAEESHFFGATHLNKILYFADFYHFKYTGKSITDAEYFKLEHGPAPKDLVRARQELIDEGRLDIKPREIAGGWIQKRPIVKKGVDEKKFTEFQRDLVSQAVNMACSYAAGQISEISHKHLSWKLAELEETIPYFTIHATRVNEITGSSKKWAEELATATALVK